MKRSNSSWSFTRRSSFRKPSNSARIALKLAALLRQPLQLARAVFVEGGVAGVAERRAAPKGGGTRSREGAELRLQLLRPWR